MSEKKPPHQKILSKGVLLNRYKIQQHLGSGYFGSVYRAEDEFGQIFSVKVVFKEQLKGYMDINEFKRQLFTISRLLLNTRSSSLLVPYDVGENDDFLFIVNEFVFGETLASKISKDGTLPLDHALFISSEIIQALYSIHSFDAIHGDLHAHNIFISPPHPHSLLPNLFDVKIDCSIHGLGFGLSRGKPEDDIHSLGLIFFQMLTGFYFSQIPLKSSDISFALKSKNPSLKEIQSSSFEFLVQLILNMRSDISNGIKPTLRQLFEATQSLLKSPDIESTVCIELRSLMEPSPVSSEHHDVFISYAKEDIDSARKLYNYLNHYDVKGWLDNEALLPGQDWQNEISTAIKNSRAFIALISSRSVDKKGFVQKEIRQALFELDKYPPGAIYIIPARLDECLPSYPRLQDLHWVDLFPNFFDGLERIIESLKDMGIAMKEYKT